MGGSSADIEALLVDGHDLSNPTPGMLPAIFRDIVGRLDAEGYVYAVVGRIALTLHEQARYMSERRARLDPYYVPVWRRILEDGDESTAG